MEMVASNAPACALSELLELEFGDILMSQIWVENSARDRYTLETEANKLANK